MTLERADGAVNARVALNRYKLLRRSVHEVQSELPGQTQRFAKTTVELQHSLVLFTIGQLLVLQARRARLEDFKAGEYALVECGIAPNSGSESTSWITEGVCLLVLEARYACCFSESSMGRKMISIRAAGS